MVCQCLVLALLSLNILVAAAQSDNPQQPEAITDGTSQAARSPAAARAALPTMLSVPWGSAVVSIRMEFAPSDPATSMGVGFNGTAPMAFSSALWYLPTRCSAPGYSDNNRHLADSGLQLCPRPDGDFCPYHDRAIRHQEQPDAAATPSAQTTPQQVNLWVTASGTRRSSGHVRILHPGLSRK